MAPAAESGGSFSIQIQDADEYPMPQRMSTDVIEAR
jgi:hypothetical protein